MNLTSRIQLSSKKKMLSYPTVYCGKNCLGFAQPLLLGTLVILGLMIVYFESSEWDRLKKAETEQN